MDSRIESAVRQYGGDILRSPRMQLEKQFFQHGQVTVFAHSFAVACLCLYLVRRLHIRADQRALVRGALLHDYFLYDWHCPDPSHRLHGLHHARRALENARADFALGRIERDIILKHMFPLPPRSPSIGKVCWCAWRTSSAPPAKPLPPRTGWPGGPMGGAAEGGKGDAPAKFRVFSKIH